ncbi:MAG: UDP-N-acetylglucosamine 2-epimerase, partial [Candidatus Cloacimonadales bacterium]
DDPERLKNIFAALREISREIAVVLPLHPRTRKIIAQQQIESEGLLLIDPVGYLEMVYLLQNCNLVMTDSGGLQKEAYFFHKLCLTMRDETEWVELVEQGFNRLVGADYQEIIKGFKLLAQQQADFSQQLYGEGEASRLIIEQLR